MAGEMTCSIASYDLHPTEAISHQPNQVLSKLRLMELCRNHYQNRKHHTLQSGGTGKEHLPSVVETSQDKIPISHGIMKRSQGE